MSLLLFLSLLLLVKGDVFYDCHNDDDNNRGNKLIKDYFFLTS